MTLLRVSGLTKAFPHRRDLLGRTTSTVNAVNAVDFELGRGETLALVGESGAGKSTTARLVLRLIEPDAGTIHFQGVDIRALAPKELRAMRRQMQMIFQDPYGSLDPRIPVVDSVAEPLRGHFKMGRRERLNRSIALLERVGIGRSERERLPEELSGGQLQRIAIARALTLEPDLIVCDEPVAALDVSVRAQVLNLMKDIQDELGVAYLFISHDLALVEVVADSVAVMRNGTIVERGTVVDIYKSPTHEYTKELLAAIPIPRPRARRAVSADLRAQTAAT